MVSETARWLVSVAIANTAALRTPSPKAMGRAISGRLASVPTRGSTQYAGRTVPASQRTRRPCQEPTYALLPTVTGHQTSGLKA